MKKRNTYISLIIIIVLALFALNNAFPKIKLPYFPEKPFKLGLDLQGGTQLIYQADVSEIESEERNAAMQGLRDVIERRVNLFGVVEPNVQLQQSAEDQRLIVELPGVKDVAQAIEMIGKTPYLEFREEIEEEPYFLATRLTGRYLKKAQLGFDQTTFEPQVLLEFDSEGKEIFRDLTTKNVGKRLAIFIDNVLISAPVVQEPISGGKAQITGRFTTEEAKELAENLSAGALPVPIKLISQNTIGPILGKISLEKSLKAGIIGFLAVLLFMISFYRVSGILASLALIIYAGILLSLFKLVPVTLTLAGIGGAILSIGMAVDANVLIFERMKEERREGESFPRALEAGFSRAWPSIRDSNLTTLIVALIMFGFGTSFIKGFALTLSFGILVSMFSALFIVRIFLRTFIGTRLEKVKWLWS